ncbi:1,4-dihydroxy-2-naphthoate octaprenyltransferase [Flavobacteriaceae bacterium F89]|uniref:1,4-dihydroxy-2-naphthoate octaprenyltransferase n=1 Tax=Cerina litoralis TaxID=2874477 RepID=A0AAE3EX17_9FLAO|nr:1,4-dihydroxy-2-naphthoate octaprenyltransferase [Cerina litoralis]MCG2461287.1 1,4-dihydroxy-2-naphthoate octaprenyltransferase [Cerina litoralis]
MTKIKIWLAAARLRTLPLSISGILVGAGLAGFYGYYDSTIFILALFTTIGFQVTSNFANDYGDGIKGTDDHDRLGPKRAYQSGHLSRRELKNGIIGSIAIDFLLVLALMYFSFEKEHLIYVALFIVLGVASIWAAIAYTVGRSAYGYKGLGDVFVFLFFGLLGVLGSMFLFTKFLTPASFFPAAAIGLLSTGVLNLNNLRDYTSDKRTGKNTLVVLFGLDWGKKYHYILLVAAFLCILIFTWLHFQRWTQLLQFVAFIPILLHLIRVSRTRDPRLIDPELKKLALSTFLLAVLFCLGYGYLN